MNSHTAPFHPNRFLGIGLSFVPPLILQRLADRILQSVHAASPRLQERLLEADGKTFLFICSDMPFQLMLSIQQGMMIPRVLPKSSFPHTDVSIHAASPVLISLLEGTADGDALFFSRDLETEGDTEALLIFRHALDNEPLALRSLFLSLFGPFQHAVHLTLKPLETLGKRFISDLAYLHQEAIFPIVQQIDQQTQQLDNLHQRVNTLETNLSKKERRGNHDT